MPTISRKQAKEAGKPTSGLQTILIPKASFSKEDARTWLRDHGFKYGNCRETANFYRFMQTNSIYGGRYATKKIENGIEFVFMR